MSERSVSCPGCKEKFGKTHIPHIFGSCGHSICSICVDEKKIGVCSDCQGTEGFLPNPKNELAIDLLAILAQMDVQQPKLEPVEDSTLNRTKPTLEKQEEPAEEPRDALPAILDSKLEREPVPEASLRNPAILDPKNAEVPVKIVNQQEPEASIITVLEREPVSEASLRKDVEVTLTADIDHSVTSQDEEPLAISAPTDVQQPTPEPAEEPTLEPAEEPTPELAEEPTPEPAEEPTLEPAEEPTPELAEEPLPAILELLKENCEVLVKIVNQLEPRDFVRLSQTCKKMYEFCFNTKEIRIVHNKLCLAVCNEDKTIPIQFAVGYEDAGGIKHFDTYRDQDFNGNEGRSLSTLEKRRKLQKYPFVFEFSRLDLHGPLTTVLLGAVRSFLSEFPVRKIYEIASYLFDDFKWDCFIQFVKDFRPRKVFIFIYEGQNVKVLMPPEAATYFLQYNESEFTTHLRVTDDVILESPLTTLKLSNSSISKETFEALVLRFAHSTDPVDWFLGCQNFDINPSTLFEERPFFNEGRVSEERPLAFFNKNQPNYFYVLRRDKNVVHCHKNGDGDAIIFNLRSSADTEYLDTVASAAVSYLGSSIFTLLDPENPVFAHIVNRLEPRDFVRLSQTCRKMHNFCFNTEEIRIVHIRLFVQVSNSRNPQDPTIFAMGYEDADGKRHCDKYRHQNYKGNDGGFLSTREKRRMLQQKYPFTFEFSRLFLNGPLKPAALTAVRDFLSEFPVKKIYDISATLFGDIDWNGLNQFVKDFHPCNVRIGGGVDEIFKPTDDATTFFLQNKEINLTCNSRVADDLILNSSHWNLHLPKSSISKETFEALVLRFAHSTDPVDWHLGCQKFSFNPSNLFKKAPPFDHEGHVSNNRPIVFFKENEPNCFYILREDRKVVHCRKSGANLISFSLLKPSEYPTDIETINYEYTLTVDIRLSVTVFQLKKESSKASDGGFLNDHETREKLRKLPFVFKLRNLVINELDPQVLASIRSFFDDFHVKEICHIETRNVSDWEGFTQFVEDFGVENVVVPSCPGTKSPPQEMRDFFQHKVIHFQCDLPIPQASSATGLEREPIPQATWQGLASSPGSANPKSTILTLRDVKNSPVFAHIVKRLDPSSLLKTCEAVDTCFTSKNTEIINYDYTLTVDIRLSLPVFQLTNGSSEAIDLDFSQEDLEKLRKLPFVFKLRKLIINKLVPQMLALIRSFFDDFHVKEICHIETRNVSDWEGFTQFVEDFRAENVVVPSCPETKSPSEEMRNFFQRESIQFRCDLPIPKASSVTVLKREPIAEVSSVTVLKREPVPQASSVTVLKREPVPQASSVTMLKREPVPQASSVTVVEREHNPQATLQRLASTPGSTAPANPNSPILTLRDAENSPVFAHIVKRLDPSSLLKTCEAVDTCFTSKGIEIINYDYTLTVDIRLSLPVFQLTNGSSEAIDLDFSQEDLEKLRKLPFVFKLRKLIINELVPQMLALIRSFFDDFHVKEICHIETRNVSDWEGFTQFIKEFGVENVVVPSCPGTKSPPEEMRNFFQRESIQFRCDLPIPEASSVTVLEREPILPEATLRRLASAVSCPGCAASFDAETHVPFIGSCGHSLCSVCLNEMKLNKNAMCRNPVCRNPEGFVWYKENELAIELLAILAQRGVYKPTLEPVEDSTLNRTTSNLEKPEEPAEEPNDTIPAILDPKNAEVPVNTVNQQEPEASSVTVSEREVPVNTVNQLEPSDVTDDSILKSSLRDLHLPNSSISKETFEALVSRFAHSTEEIGWSLRCQTFDFHPSTLFEEVLPFNHDGLVSEKRPLVFVKENEPGHFYILREDGKVVHCIKRVEGPAQFSMLGPSEYPPCLQND